jgi:hypothetical protein
MQALDWYLLAIVYIAGFLSGWVVKLLWKK